MKPLPRRRAHERQDPLDRSIVALHSIPESVLAVVSPKDHWTDAAQAEHALQLAARMTPAVGELVEVLVVHWLAEAEAADDWVTIDAEALPGPEVSRTLHHLGYLVVVIGNEPRPLVRVARIRSAEGELVRVRYSIGIDAQLMADCIGRSARLELCLSHLDVVLCQLCVCNLTSSCPRSSLMKPRSTEPRNRHRTAYSGTGTAT